MDPNNPYNPYNPNNTPPQQQQPGYGGQQPFQPNPYTGYNPNPYPGEAGNGKKPGSSKKLLLILGGVVLVLAIVGATILIMSSGDSGNKKDNTTTNNTQQNTDDPNAADVVARNDGQLDLESRIDITKSIKEQTIKAKIKEQINLSSGFSFMATKIESYTSTDPAVVPAAGKQFVAVSVAAGDRSQSSTISVSYLDFKLRDNDGNLLSGHNSTQQIISNSLAKPTQLKPGDQITGKVVFEVDATDTDWVLVHKETYQKTTDNTTFNVEGDAVVSLKPAGTAPPSPTTPPPSPSST